MHSMFVDRFIFGWTQGDRWWRVNAKNTHCTPRAYLVEQPHPNPAQGPALAFRQGVVEGNGARRGVAVGGGKEHGDGQRHDGALRGVAAAGGGGDVDVGGRVGHADGGDGVPQADVGALGERVDEGGVATCVVI